MVNGIKYLHPDASLLTHISRITYGRNTSWHIDIETRNILSNNLHSNMYALCKYLMQQNIDFRFKRRLGRRVQDNISNF